MSTNHRQRVEQIPAPLGADEVEVGDYLWALWNYRLLIVLGTVACAAAGFGLAAASQKVYQAMAVVSAAPPNGGELPFAVISQVRNLLQNAAVVEQALAKHPAAAKGLTPGVFISKNLSVERNRDTNLWMVSVRLPDGVAAADVANVLADEAVAGHRRAVDDAQKVRAEARRDDPLESRLAEMRMEERQAREALVRFRTNSQIEEIRAGRDEAIRLRQELAAIDSELAAEQAAQRQLQADLGRQSSAGVTTLLAGSRARVAALQQRRETVGRREALLGRNAASLPDLELQVADLQRAHQQALDRLTVGIRQAAARDTQPAVTLQAIAVTVLQRATPPASPVAPRPVRSLLLGAAFGLFVFVLAALVLDAVRPQRRAAIEGANAA